MRYAEVIAAVCATFLLVGCGEVDTSYGIKASPRRNMAVTALVDSTAQRLRLKLDREGLSPTWHSYARGALSYNLGTKPGAPTDIFLADGRLLHKRDFNGAKQDLTHGLRGIDPKVQMDTRWITNPMM